MLKHSLEGFFIGLMLSESYIRQLIMKGSAPLFDKTDSLNILHTADWHIGKVLHKHALRDELLLFFDWLLELLKTKHIDILLVSGDIFDLANPAVKDRKVYYQFLTQLIQLDIKVIITGGNHDAVGLLNAPQTILDQLNITVIGGAEEEIEQELIPIMNVDGTVELVIAAVPFLRDKDLRSQEIDTQFKNRAEAIREGIKTHYAQLATLCEQNYPNIPAIAMGHLYAKGVLPSDSERDIHVGNAAAVDSSIFSKTFNYVALGHIHRPQIINKNPFIRYSGSPIALSFSEKADNKSVVLLTLEKGTINAPEIVAVPKFRSLTKFTGDLSTITTLLSDFKPDFPLTSFVEIEVSEDKYSDITLGAVDELVAKYSDSSPFVILKARTTFIEKSIDTSSLFEEGEHIEDLRTIDVFNKMMAHQEINKDQQEMLKEAFLEIMESVTQSEVE